MGSLAAAAAAAAAAGGKDGWKGEDGLDSQNVVNGEEKGGAVMGAEGIRRLFKAQKRYVDHFFDNLCHEEALSFAQALLRARDGGGSILFTGVGKSGFVARKISHTLSSLGFPRASFLSPLDALHGDIGALHGDSLLVLISKSGSSDELLRLVPCARARGARIVSLTSVTDCPLSRLSDLNVHLPLIRELCPFDLAPVTSAAIQMLFGDTVAVALMEATGLTLEQYASNHPAGRIGRSLTFKVKDVMKNRAEELPLCNESDLIVDQLVELTSKGCGCLLVVDHRHRLMGTFTDGDLRRTLKANGEGIFKITVGGVCNRKPRTIGADEMAVDAMRKMEAAPSPVQFLPVVDDENVVTGIVTLHALVSAGL